MFGSTSKISGKLRGHQTAPFFAARISTTDPSARGDATDEQDAVVGIHLLDGQVQRGLTIAAHPAAIADPEHATRRGTATDGSGDRCLRCTVRGAQTRRTRGAS